MKTNLKTIFKRKTDISKTLSSIKQVSFPEKELKKWLKNRKHWNNDDWLLLLDNLRKLGYSGYTDSEEGRTKIGQFLEAKRDKF